VKSGKNTKKYAQRSHLQKFHWLVLSHKDKGLCRKYCVFFSIGLRGGHQTNTLLRRLVKEPLKMFDNLLGEKGDLTLHERNRYHVSAVQAGKIFLLTYNNPDLEISNQLVSQRHAQVKENKERYFL
jgi:hypothetical protein